MNRLWINPIVRFVLITGVVAALVLITTGNLWISLLSGIVYYTLSRLIAWSSNRGNQNGHDGHDAGTPAPDPRSRKGAQ